MPGFWRPTEDLVAPGLQLPHDVGTGCVVQLHADLQEGPFAAEAVEEGQGLRLSGEVTGDDDVFSH